jgi:DNA (cytosine-5)-methyltransferase 1
VKPHVFSFFSGAGFLDLGFEDEEFEIVYVNEFFEPFMEAYKHARRKNPEGSPRYGYFVDSIEKLLSKDNIAILSKFVLASRGTGVPVGFIGGPPCPDFSVAGKNKGENGENGKLSKSYIDLIIKHKPDFFVFENVKGLYRTKVHREFFESLKAQLVKSGYSLQERLINSLEYGAPQDRDRIILVGLLNPINQEFLKPTDWENEMVYTKEEVFSINWPETDLPSKSRLKPKDIPHDLTIQHWFDRNDVAKHPNQTNAFTPRAGLARFETVHEGDVSRKSYKRLHRYRYSPTAAYGNNEVHIHPYLPRRISAAEALAIQSLPAEFELPSTMTLTAMFKSIGNGVPYLAARGLARMLRKTLKREFK